ncbi:MAG: hypothetical protein A2Y62_21225 [Candidatus Fischerbacteria bacterium RBG_13_37_8]|uniref:Uncharacterized protein n=1 Tax=Candidatus Fischerbacteria bacterium RBG_13_37_8 TaxID=1817863 RepID=A0A1F5V4Z6_9BACT|nr:MAG: hypothetical protein A2Y62_21225 [Candidatus Fischerbacteria bacterium RBG_13_37_8]HJX50434.1 hypothetical protein [Candidatus Nanoarchaeia archaeon]
MKKQLKRILKILHKSNEKAWRDMAIRGIADFNKYAEFIENEKKRNKIIVLAGIIFLVILLLVAYYVLP